MVGSAAPLLGAQRYDTVIAGLFATLREEVLIARRNSEWGLRTPASNDCGLAKKCFCRDLFGG